MSEPVVAKSTWTFDLSGVCIYCDKKVTRVRTFNGASFEAVQPQVDRAMEFLCHKKCGGY